MSTLWNEHDAFRTPLPDPYAIGPNEVAATLASIRNLRPDALAYRTLGQSAEGREITLVEIGDGPVSTLAWSQMHGDEPTHTAVLLDLLNFLQSQPDHPAAAAILSHLRLAAIVMLNPDGAARQTRHNAQGIDINRDARALASPEGRLLHHTVLDLKPDFAFNLHNHNPRRTVAATGQAAAVALLAPPIDDAGSCPDNVLAAQQVASWVRQTVEMHAPGMVARYEADYMPRAFGEWVQQQGAATLLIEAGGWSTLAAEPLRRLHFVALAAALSGIASGDYRRVDVARYRSLPGTGDADLFDLTIVGPEVVVRPGLAPYRADLGVNAPGIRLQADDTLRGATIAEIGDLCLARGKNTLDARDAYCLPGRVAWSPAVTPRSWPTRETQHHWLQQGVTTLLGMLDLSVSDAQWRRLSEALRDPPGCPLQTNLGWIATADPWTDVSLARLAAAAPWGVVAVASRQPSKDLEALINACRIERVADLLPADGERFVQVALPSRSGVSLGAIADLAIVERSAEPHAGPVAARDLRQVIVGGTVVLDRGQFFDAAPGVLLSRS